LVRFSSGVLDALAIGDVRESKDRPDDLVAAAEERTTTDRDGARHAVRAPGQSFDTVKRASEMRLGEARGRRRGRFVVGPSRRMLEREGIPDELADRVVATEGLGCDARVCDPTALIADDDRLGRMFEHGACKLR